MTLLLPLNVSPTCARRKALTVGFAKIQTLPLHPAAVGNLIVPFDTVQMITQSVGPYVSGLTAVERYASEIEPATCNEQFGVVVPIPTLLFTVAPLNPLTAPSTTVLL